VIFIRDIELILDWLFFRVSISLLISSFISWIIYLISFTCLFAFSLSSFVCSHSFWGQILTFVFLLWGH
jgi:hypothetical protein